jgi:hypothetical protein
LSMCCWRKALLFFTFSYRPAVGRQLLTCKWFHFARHQGSAIVHLQQFGSRDEAVCGELLICHRNQQFDTHEHFLHVFGGQPGALRKAALRWKVSA